MKIAYIILAHCDPKQLHNAVKELIESGDVFIHINKKVNIQPFISELKEYADYNNIQFVINRKIINWGGYSILEGTFNSLEQCLNYKNYDRIVMLTGLDYPIKNSKYIKCFFEKNRDSEFIKANIATGNKVLLKYYAFFDNKIWFKYFRLIPALKCFSFLAVKKDYVVYNGENHNIFGVTPKWAITGNTARKILCFFREKNKVNSYFKSTYAPDDYYVATVIRFFVDEKTICDLPLFYEQISNKNKSNVKILDSSDFAKLQQSSCLFARKFDSRVSAELLVQLVKS